MLGNLKNPPEPFKDIILTHFRLKAKSITTQLDEWLKLDDGKAMNGAGGGYVTLPGSVAPGQAGGSGGSSRSVWHVHLKYLSGAAGGLKKPQTLPTSFRAIVEELKRVLAGLTRGEDPTVPMAAGSSSTTASATPGSTDAPTAADDMEGLEYD